MKQRVLLLGAGGQLGKELVLTAGSDIHCTSLTRRDLDIGDAREVGELLDSCPADVLVNAAAYTAVDAAESDVTACERANAEGPANLARACRERRMRLLHVSTDFVFDGEASVPYSPTSAPAPLGQYGRSKLAGEKAVQSILPEALILRTSWVYSRYGNNFVKTMLRLMSERDELSVVEDQVGSPTWARGLAAAIWAAVARPQLSGVYHWTDAGECSWFDFARAIYEEATSLGLLKRSVRIQPIPSSEYPTAAARPSYSVLDTESAERDLQLPAQAWRPQLRLMLVDLKESIDD